MSVFKIHAHFALSVTHPCLFLTCVRLFTAVQRVVTQKRKCSGPLARPRQAVGMWLSSPTGGARPLTQLQGETEGPHIPSLGGGRE